MTFLTKHTTEGSGQLIADFVMWFVRMIHVQFEQPEIPVNEQVRRAVCGKKQPCDHVCATCKHILKDVGYFL